eukprot:gene26222-32762_t
MSSVPSLKALLAKYPTLKVQKNGKVICKVTGHEMVAEPSVVHAYVTGKRFVKEIGWHNYNYDEFLPFIKPNRDDMKYILVEERRIEVIDREERKAIRAAQKAKIPESERLKQKNKKRKVSELVSKTVSGEGEQEQSEEEEEDDNESGNEGEQHSDVEEEEEEEPHFEVEESSDEEHN